MTGKIKVKPVKFRKVETATTAIALPAAGDPADCDAFALFIDGSDREIRPEQLVD